MVKDALQALTQLASSPVLKIEDRPIVALLIRLAGERAGGITMLELLAASQDEGSHTHFQHPLADVLTGEFVGEFWDEYEDTSFEFQAEFGFYTDTYSVWNGNISFHWKPARYVRQQRLEEEQRSREFHTELERDAAALGAAELDAA